MRADTWKVSGGRNVRCFSGFLKGACLRQLKKRAREEAWELHPWVLRDPENVLVPFGSRVGRPPLHRAVLPKMCSP